MFHNPLNLKLVSVFFFLCLIEITVIIRPVTLFLVRILHVPKEVLYFFEVIAIPVTVFILSQYVWQFLKWKAVYRKVFAIGYGAMLLLMVLAAFVPRGSSALEAIGNNIVVLSIFHFLITVGNNLSLYTGWMGWTLFSIGLHLTVFVILPLCAGFLAILLYLGGVKIRKMVR